MTYMCMPHYHPMAFISHQNRGQNSGSKTLQNEPAIFPDINIKLPPPPTHTHTETHMQIYKSMQTPLCLHLSSHRHDYMSIIHPCTDTPHLLSCRHLPHTDTPLPTPLHFPHQNYPPSPRMQTNLHLFHTETPTSPSFILMQTSLHLPHTETPLPPLSTFMPTPLHFPHRNYPTSPLMQTNLHLPHTETPSFPSFTLM